MAFTTGFGFTNKTAGTKTLATTALGEASNYALITDEAGETYLSNLTSPLDQAEKLSIKAQTLAKVSTSNTPMYPVPNGAAGGIQFSLKDELIYRHVTGEGEAQTVTDIPVVCTLTVKHGRHAAITADVVAEAVARTFSMLYADDGSCRIAALQRLATKPEND